ncbi:MAG: putative DNA modification/repair radical SAM protein [Candidatus Auribacter fodinae]|jgi:putative DNA modification/repair radical SAM protein|uniref:Putative DNA modification/repair radical SAM protein n=1 Tax=Candidatus Auribacter fodinae TaxID=2093366 RepID=A0A3A4QWT9_9BACT|nr:MAG: putative DNA modification/repair radical SAM protein [Candidatus Auribacter fodinae]
MIRESALKKLTILAESAKYDASCASSGSNRAHSAGVGTTQSSGICHSWAADGRCISLLKILMTNVCIYNCTYCINRANNDVPRAAFTPEEICELTMNFYTKNYIEGLFLSSGVIQSPDHTMELLIKTVRRLREIHRFNGYIHLKLIPGANLDLVHTACRYADRVSINIELPSRESLAMLAPQKKVESILLPMHSVGETLQHNQEVKKKKNKPKTMPAYTPAGQSTQLIIGATPETDLQIMRLSSWLYEKMTLKRVYYSAYIPVNNDSRLPVLHTPPLLREHRLYQADWLLRFYGFSAEELLDEAHPRFDVELDPKICWALRNPGRFPVELNIADYEVLLRVPGIGVRSAKKIIALRKVQRIQYNDLRKLHIVLKRAQYFFTVNGKYYGDTPLDPAAIRNRLTIPYPGRVSSQLDLFDINRDTSDLTSAISGEI